MTDTLFSELVSVFRRSLKLRVLICFKNGYSYMSGATDQNIKTLCRNIFSRKETLRFVSNIMANFDETEDFVFGQNCKFMEKNI